MEATERRPPTRSARVGSPAGFTEERSTRDHVEREGNRIGGEDPLGLKESWLKMRESLCRHATREKVSKENHFCLEKDQREQSMERIRDKLKQLREDLNTRLRERDREIKERVIGESQLADPPDEGGGSRSNPINSFDSQEEGNQYLPIPIAGTPGEGEGTSSIKDQSGERVPSQKHSRAITIKNSGMADEYPWKNKALLYQEEEVASNGKGGLGTRPMERGGTSCGRGDLYRTPEAQGMTAPQRARHGDVGQVVAPVFPVSMGVQTSVVVALDLSKERAAMRSRWITIGLFFSVQLFSVNGLFQELKSKWGLCGHLNYSSVKNNRFLLEFESEGDLRFILNNGPWTHRGDPFLMAAVDGSARPGDVEVAHMPIWARIFDAPPIMFFDTVARDLGGLLGKVLEVDSDREGRIWGESIRDRIQHDVDEPLCSMIEFHDKSENVMYRLNVKYERLPRFCSYCGHLGHGQRECKLPADLQKMRFSAAMCASPFKRSSSRGGFVVPEAASARRFLHFESEAIREAKTVPAVLAAARYREVPEEVLADPLVHEAIAAVSAIKLRPGKEDKGGNNVAIKAARPDDDAVMCLGEMTSPEQTPPWV